NDSMVDRTLDEAMHAARQIVELGRRIRGESKVRVRQPLLEAVVHYPGDHDALRPLLPLVAQELNVKRVVFAESAEQLGRWRAKPNFRRLGPRLVQDARKAAGLEITDRIELGIQTSGDLARAVAAHRDEIAGETLATGLTDGAVAGFRQEASIEGWPVTITLRKK